MPLTGVDPQLRIGEPAGHVLTMRAGDDDVRVTVAQERGHPDIFESEAPGSPKQYGPCP